MHLLFCFAFELFFKLECTFKHVLMGNMRVVILQADETKPARIYRKTQFNHRASVKKKAPKRVDLTFLLMYTQLECYQLIGFW